MIHGIINVYKEQGFTSHDVVAKLRGILKQKKIGHTGTLDPDATGVLPVCLGKGTKLCDMLTDRDKTYQAVLLLGTVTDTQDTSGTVLAQKEVTSTEEEVQEAIRSFTGDYEQIPPMYSALKVDGKKLYELAREGKVIERKARLVHIHEIRIDEAALPRITMTVSCSKGTYIRTLCHDIGDKLGCGGCMESLIRTKAGSFVIEDSITLGQIEELRDNGTLMDHITPIDEMFLEYPRVDIREEFHKLLYNGNMFYDNHTAGQVPMQDGLVRVYDAGGQFFAVYGYEKAEKRFKPVKIFAV